MEQSGQAQRTEEPWNMWPDFTLAFETGEELKCHKMMLARSSSFFKAMLSNDCDETRNSRMIVKELSLEAVKIFLEYIYVEQEWRAEQEERVLKFDKAKLTPELMMLAHMYDVKTLHSQCAAYLRQNICDDNVVGIWIEADRCQDLDLIECALKYLASKSEEIASVPGMEEAFKSPKFMKQLSVFLASHCNHLAIEGTDKEITVNVRSLYSGSEYQVRTCTRDTIKMLKEATHKVLWPSGRRTTQDIEPQFFKLDNVKLKEDRTLASYGIDEGSQLEYFLK